MTELEPWAPPAPPALPEFAEGWEEEYLGAFPRTLQDRARSEPEFRASLLAHRHFLLDILRHEAIRRAIEPKRRPIYQRGELVGWEETPDNAHLQWMLERMEPDEFNLARKLEVTGKGGAPISFAFPMGETELEADEGEFEELPGGDN